MQALFVFAALAGGGWSLLIHRRHARVLPGGSFFVLRLNGAFQAGIGVVCAVLAMFRVIGLALGQDSLSLEGQDGEMARLLAGMSIATTIPLVVVHLMAIGLMWNLKRRPAVAELGIAVLSWSVGALGIAGLELGPGFVPGLSGE